jgi:hypothetical protein
MAKPNYSFEKRQRELAKKKKKEEKARDKADRKVHGDAPDGENAPQGADGDAGEAQGASGEAPAAG